MGGGQRPGSLFDQVRMPAMEALLASGAREALAPAWQRQHDHALTGAP